MSLKYGYCLATLRTDDSDEDLDGYMGIFHSNTADESDGIDADVADVLTAHGYDIADENHVAIPKGGVKTLRELIRNDPILKTLVQYDPNLQKEMSEYDGVYDFEFAPPC